MSYASRRKEQAMEDKELHPVVTLLLARIESHPEEFAGSGDHRMGLVVRKKGDTL